ncbi:zf-HC2 domain-containing protein [Rhodopirellula sp. P2]|uniref:zf-HC2 domain-containing protein n=1 Tax=Rhodopirellula sp. P2 TaxID=2127060 RepID=UPI002368A51A|nr:zf-HC2 domain-containing protein [Rhodopirellula sp. P2]WDQ19232.1 zf-HC2 domain-containing protein [Rhodopirellula sp. P2]
MVRQDFEAHSDWEECSPGTIADLHNRLHAVRRRQSAVRMGTPIAVMAVLGMGVWNFGGTANPPESQEQLREFDFGGVTCSEVQASSQQYATGQLTPDQQQAFTLHLQQCPLCQQESDAMQTVELTLVGENPTGNSPSGSPTHRPLLASNVD